MISRLKISKNGPELSKIILGFWRLLRWNYDKNQLIDFIKYSNDLGITSFDHADIYGSYKCEELFGESLKAEPSLRNKLELITKCSIVFESPQRPEYKFHYYDTSKDHIIKSVHRSLKNFGTDYIDILLIHRPDSLMNYDDTAEGLSKVVKDGKIKFVGVSNFLPAQFESLQSRLNIPLITNQIEFSVLNMEALENGTLDLSQRLKASPMIWSPLAGGRLFNEDSDRVDRIRATLNALSEKYDDAPLDQLAIAWILKHPSKPFPIIGTGLKERIKRAVGSLRINLSREDWFRIWSASKGHEVP
ncbi:aldo/keto reductase family oxidoreductase [Bacteroidota bacterium]